MKEEELDSKYISTLRVVDLKEELEKRGLSKSGTKKDLSERLKVYVRLQKERQLGASRADSEAPNTKLQMVDGLANNDLIKQYLAKQQAQLIERKVSQSSTEGTSSADNSFSNAPSSPERTATTAAGVDTTETKHQEQAVDLTGNITPDSGRPSRRSRHKVGVYLDADDVEEEESGVREADVDAEGSGDASPSKPKRQHQRRSRRRSSTDEDSRTQRSSRRSFSSSSSSATIEPSTTTTTASGQTNTCTNKAEQSLDSRDNITSASHQDPVAAPAIKTPAPATADTEDVEAPARRSQTAEVVVKEQTDESRGEVEKVDTPSDRQTVGMDLSVRSDSGARVSSDDREEGDKVAQHSPHKTHTHTQRDNVQIKLNTTGANTVAEASATYTAEDGATVDHVSVLMDKPEEAGDSSEHVSHTETRSGHDDSEAVIRRASQQEHDTDDAVKNNMEDAGSQHHEAVDYSGNVEERENDVSAERAREASESAVEEAAADDGGVPVEQHNDDDTCELSGSISTNDDSNKPGSGQQAREEVRVDVKTHRKLRRRDVKCVDPAPRHDSQDAGVEVATVEKSSSCLDVATEVAGASSHETSKTKCEAQHSPPAAAAATVITEEEGGEDFLEVDIHDQWREDSSFWATQQPTAASSKQVKSADRHSRMESSANNNSSSMTVCIDHQDEHQKKKKKRRQEDSHTNVHQTAAREDSDTAPSTDERRRLKLKRSSSSQQSSSAKTRESCVEEPDKKRPDIVSSESTDQNTDQIADKSSADCTEQRPASPQYLPVNFQRIVLKRKRRPHSTSGGDITSEPQHHETPVSLTSDTLQQLMGLVPKMSDDVDMSDDTAASYHDIQDNNDQDEDVEHGDLTPSSSPSQSRLVAAVEDKSQHDVSNGDNLQHQHSAEQDQQHSRTGKKQRRDSGRHKQQQQEDRPSDDKIDDEPTSSSSQQQQQDNTTSVEGPQPPLIKRTISQSVGVARATAAAAASSAVMSEREPSPARHRESTVVFVRNLVRPFTVNQLRELLARTGTITQFWIDNIKSKCYCQYESLEQAVETRTALHRVRWPASNPKRLTVDYASEQQINTALNNNNNSGGAAGEGGGAVDPHFATKQQEQQRQQRAQQLRRESVREWDKVKLDERSPGEKERQRDSRKRLREQQQQQQQDVEHLQPADRDAGSRRRRGEENTQHAPPPSHGHDNSNDNDSSVKQQHQQQQAGETETPVKLLDDLFRKTVATPCIYWLPLSEQQVADRMKQREQRLVERQQRRQQQQQQQQKENRTQRRSNSRTRRR